MPPDTSPSAEARRWFVIVREDLRCADLDLEADPPALGDALFHCQQAVEKALKGFLAWHSQPFRKVHDLHELGEQGVAIDASLGPHLLAASFLTKFQVMYRYPYEEPEPTYEDARRALTLAREVVEAILSRLPAETRP